MLGRTGGRAQLARGRWQGAFLRFRRKIETPFNLIDEARPFLLIAIATGKDLAMIIQSTRNFISIASLAALLALPLASTSAAAQVAPLDGKTFVADAGLKGKDADEKGDIITFKDGKFHSSFCDQYGYGKGNYKSTAQGDAISFEAETTSEKDGRLVWKGLVRGDTVEGTFIHYRKGGFFNSNPAPLEHWFKGRTTP